MVTKRKATTKDPIKPSKPIRKEVTVLKTVRDSSDMVMFTAGQVVKVLSDQGSFVYVKHPAHIFGEERYVLFDHEIKS